MTKKDEKNNLKSIKMNEFISVDGFFCFNFGIRKEAFISIFIEQYTQSDSKVGFGQSWRLDFLIGRKANAEAAPIG